MTFDPKSKLVIDVDDAGTIFIIRCPFWANELLRDMPSRRWNKKLNGHTGPIIRQNVEFIEKLAATAGVVKTEEAESALAAYWDKHGDPNNRGTGFPTWYKFKTEPRKHQAAAINKGYWSNAFALFMDMQTGKSKTAIDLTVAHRMEGHTDGVLILVKLSLRKNWIRQLNEHCPIPFVTYLPDTGKQKEFERWLSHKHDFKVMIVGWESLSAGGMAKMCERYLLSLSKPTIIGDETTYISGHNATRSGEAVRLARLAAYRYALTGTPAEEGPMNLFMQFEFLDPEIVGIGDFYAFRNRYAVMGGFVPKEGRMKGKPTKIVGYQNMDELMSLIAPYVFQVQKSDVYDLPPKRYEVREIELTKEQREVYQLIKKEGIISHGNEEVVLKNTLEVMLRLHQVTGGYAVKPRTEIRRKANGEEVAKIVYEPVELVPPDKNPKIIELMETVEEFKHKKQGLIWAVYIPEIRAIIHMMKKMGLRVGELHGKIPEEDRQPMVDAFEAGDFDLIVGNASTGGMGYTMQAAEVSIFYNNTFKRIDRVQAEDRPYGDGQTKSGIWIDLVTSRTVDVTIMKALEAKQDVADYVRHRIKETTALLDGE